ncbi:peptide deformylase [Salinarimonas chemoclinalis]|uniref:peptide deformylase n=1 Tax=Salinarimonas chemoclinalis TaxID=3241599 RepID=UPI003558938F
MSVRPILVAPAPALRAVSARVEAFDGTVAGAVDDLLETMRARGAIGLSAPQIGDARRIAVIDPSGDGAAPEAFVNPRIVARGRAYGFVQESCLSLPGVVASVWRDTRVRVSAQDAQGRSFERDLAGLAAVSLQHEIDHLDGRLFVDRLGALRRWALRRRLGTAAAPHDGAPSAVGQ